MHANYGRSIILGSNCEKRGAPVCARHHFFQKLASRVRATTTFRNKESQSHSHSHRDSHSHNHSHSHSQEKRCCRLRETHVCSKARFSCRRNHHFSKRGQPQQPVSLLQNRLSTVEFCSNKILWNLLSHLCVQILTGRELLAPTARKEVLPSARDAFFSSKARFTCRRNHQLQGVVATDMALSKPSKFYDQL